MSVRIKQVYEYTCDYCQGAIQTIDLVKGETKEVLYGWVYITKVESISHPPGQAPHLHPHCYHRILGDFKRL